MLEIAQLLETGAGKATLLDRVAELADGKEETSRYRSPEQVRRHWFTEWRRRIAGSRDLIIVIDADRTEGGTRIGKSTLGLSIISELDRTVTPENVSSRIAGGASDLARFVSGCKRGQGFLYDEGMWGARSRDAMSPDSKMVGEVLGTLASRGAIVVFCCHSMLTLDTEVKALAAYRLLVRERGVAEVHTPQIQLDLERPRLLPFREAAEYSPFTWDRLTGPLWRAYSNAKRRLQDARIARKLEEQRVWEARRLGLSPQDYVQPGVPAGEIGAARARPREWQCEKCGSTWGRRADRDRHQTRCVGRTDKGSPANATPRPPSAGPLPKHGVSKAPGGTESPRRRKSPPASPRGRRLAPRASRPREI